jgi:hypothetical protein
MVMVHAQMITQVVLHEPVPQIVLDQIVKYVNLNFAYHNYFQILFFKSK